jgi:predicted esterase
VTPPEPGREGTDLPSPFHESRLPVTRTARYLTAGPDPADASEVWFALHGYGQLARRFARALRPLATGSRLLVVPEALSRFYRDGATGSIGASWMTREDRTTEIADYVAFLDAVLAAVAPPADCPSVILGFSQGAATACRWVTTGGVRPGRLILWSGGLPPDLSWPAAAARLRRTRVTFVNGRDDAGLAPSEIRQQCERLRAHDVEADERWFAGGHVIDRGTLVELANL